MDDCVKVGCVHHGAEQTSVDWHELPVHKVNVVRTQVFVYVGYAHDRVGDFS